MKQPAILLGTILILLTQVLLAQDNPFNPAFDDSWWNRAQNPWNNAPFSPVTSSDSMWDPDNGQLAVFRRVFWLNSLPSSATLKISVDNVYMAAINAFDGGDGGALWQDGNWRELETIDVLDQLNVGDNVILLVGLELGGFGLGEYEGAYVELLADGVPVVSSADHNWKSLSLDILGSAQPPNYNGYLYMQFPYIWSFSEQRWIYMISNPWVYDMGGGDWFQLGGE